MSERQHVSDAAWNARYSDCDVESRSDVELSHWKDGVMLITVEEWDRRIEDSNMMLAWVEKFKADARAQDQGLIDALNNVHRLETERFCMIAAHNSELAALHAETERLRRLLRWAENGPPEYPGPRKKWRAGPPL